MSTTREWRCERCTAIYESPDTPRPWDCSEFDSPCPLTEVYVVPVGEVRIVAPDPLSATRFDHFLEIPIPEEEKS